MPEKKSIVMLGATGAVGGEVVKKLLQLSTASDILLLGRNFIQGISSDQILQQRIDVTMPSSYRSLITKQQVAICTLGIGQPSKVTKETFVAIDKKAVLDFALVCKQSGIRHFQLLSSVGINASSKASFYLKVKGELVEELKALNFERLSIFQPSMILTPSNRYGFVQGVTLKIWPLLKPFLQGSLKKYRGVLVEELGSAMALNIQQAKTGVEYLTWQDFDRLNKA